MLKLLSSGSFALLLFAVACSSSTSSGSPLPPSPDAGGPDAADAGSCYTLTNTTSAITDGCGFACPDCTQTSLADGTYVLTEWQPTTMTSGCNMDNGLSHGILVAKGNTVEWVIDANNGPPFGTIDHYQARGTFTVDGSGLHLDAECGSSEDVPFNSNANGDILLGQGHFVRQ